jgi:hypothetical protein
MSKIYKKLKQPSRFIIKVTDTKTGIEHEEWINTKDIGTAMKEYEDNNLPCEWEIIYEYRLGQI